MKTKYFETVIGFLILLISFFFIIKYLNVNTESEVGSYKLGAKFLKVGGIKVGNDIKLRGVKVGTVSNVNLDENFMANVEFFIYSNVKIPDDSQISINSDGILGNKYLSILPNESLNFLSNGDTIKKVIDYESIEDQVSKIIFLATQ